MSSVARHACKFLIQAGEMDHSLDIARAIPQRQVCSAFGHSGITPTRQQELGLISINLSVLCKVMSTNRKPGSLTALGEAFLKFFFAAYFYARHQYDLEGPLTQRIHNETCVSTIASYVISSDLVSNVRSNLNSYSEDIAGDVFRGVIGAAVSCSGPDNTIKVARSLGMVADTAVATIKDIKTIHDIDRPAYFALPVNVFQVAGTTDAKTARTTHEVERITGYLFQDPELLMQAITHDVASTNSTTQRLELLGDAVLEFLVEDHYYQKRPETPIGNFRTFKSMILSNDALGSLFASLGLDEVLTAGIKGNAKWKKDAADVVHLRRTGVTDWTKLKLGKTLGDAMEALVGAIFVDAGFDLAPVQDILSSILYPFVDGSYLKCPIGVKRGLVGNEVSTNSKRTRM
ncbi:Dicer-like protein 2 [Mortierella sp. AD094]|nr:Dicer-like protein 2 [Mortierella sp. AD094]